MLQFSSGFKVLDKMKTKKDMIAARLRETIKVDLETATDEELLKACEGSLTKAIIELDIAIKDFGKAIISSVPSWLKK